MKIIFLALAIFITKITESAAYIPETGETVIASWKQDQETLYGQGRTANERMLPNITQALLKAEAYLKYANNIGKSYLYGLAQSELQPFMNDSNNPQLWLTWARIQQHKHQFDQAIISLNKVLAYDKKNINANLLMARIYLIKKQHKLAKSFCLKLMDSAVLNTMNICLLEVMSYAGKLSESYKNLSALMQQQVDDTHKSWLSLILADMAYRLSLFKQAEQWLDDFPLDENTSYLSEWADIKLLLIKPFVVQSKLERLAQGLLSLEDGLLLRLALAEKQINLLENKQHNKWQQRMKQRVKLRELRQDKHHASDLARYYLDIEANQEKALYWANINWQQAQEYKDLMLLNRAQLN